MVFVLMALFCVSDRCAHSEASADKSRAVLDAWLGNIMRGIAIKIEPKVIPIEDETLQEVFPDERFYGFYIPRWPVAIKPPKELSYETIVSVQRDGPVEPIRDAKTLTIFLTHKLVDIKNEPRARAALRASLRLAEAGAKDGP